ncbi:MAG TPA: hypothetical protein VLV49_12000 [Terriglobales bacterium]|nr:hypothetical protein [Terriglobales bacterium]
MKLRSLPVVLVLLPILAGTRSRAGTTNPPPISSETRRELIHDFTADLVYIRTPFPMGRTGLKLQDGVVTPSGEDLDRMMGIYGPSVKPGDLARISAIVIKENHIRFELNGGPIRKKKWYQHIEVGTGYGTAPIAPSDPNANPRGTYLDLVFDHYVPELNPKQLKDLLSPVFDFNSKSALEAYLETVPPKVKEAIKNHRVLVGMNQEMVIYAKGRAPNKIREKDAGGDEYEEWIYGQPPQDVEFVRFIGDEVVRIETMTVTGEKTVRTAKEVDIPKPTVAKDSEQTRPANAPTLRRPGEAPDAQAPVGAPGTPPPVLAPPPDMPGSGTPQPQ